MEGSNEVGPMLGGLKGMWLQIMQGGAIVLICFMFYQDRHEALLQARDDRQMFRAELAEQRKALDRVVIAVDALTEKVEKLKP